MTMHQPCLLLTSVNGCALPPRQAAPKLRVKAHAQSAKPVGNDSNAAYEQLNPAAIKPVQCLKEWAVTNAALGHGEQTVLFRKGGIREPTFRPKVQQFLLFPTAFHTEAPLLQPGVAERYQQEMQMEPRQMQQLPLPYFARITRAWTTRDPEVLWQLSPLHVYTKAFLDTRLKWRPKDPLTLLELRCYRLEQPLLIPAREQYFGCFSWVELVSADAGIDRSNGQQGAGGSSSSAARQSWLLRPALDDPGFKRKQDILSERLQQLQVEPLMLA